jgi:DNA damage-binding protein 1
MLMCRSALLAKLEGLDYLFVGLGDGALFTFLVEPSAGSLFNRRKVALGTQPLALCTFINRGAQAVFVACDRPTIVHSKSRKLLFSNVNMPPLSYMAPFHSGSFPECLALASQEGLTIGAVDEIQKLHVRTVPLGEQPRRIAHHLRSHTFVVAIEGTRMSAGGEELVEAGSLRLYDESSFELLSTFNLDPYELAFSIVCASLGSDTLTDAATATGGAAAIRTEHIIVGTAYVLEAEEEPTRGRILVLGVDGASSSSLGSTASSGRSQFKLLTMHEVSGGVLALASLASGKLAAGINSKVQVYDWITASSPPSSATTGSKRSAAREPAVGAAANAMDVDSDDVGPKIEGDMVLLPGSAFHRSTLVLGIDARGDFLLVSDLMKSVSLLRLSPTDGGFT